MMLNPKKLFCSKDKRLYVFIFLTVCDNSVVIFIEMFGFL
jgi:hypothetical protein